MIFVDASAVLAVINPNDEQHATAAPAWNKLIASGEELLMTSYVLLELIALAQRRLGLDAVRILDAELLPLIEVVWIDPEIHHAAVAAVLAAGRRNLSLVDCASFEVMRRKGLRTAFTLDRHFAEQGFAVTP